MELELVRTGDTWMDWGLVAFADFMDQASRYLDRRSLSEERLICQIRPELVDRFRQELTTYLKQKLNDLVLPAVEMKVLNLPYRIPDAQGCWQPDYQVNLTDHELETLKGTLKQSPRQVTVSLRRNYVGLKNDWRRLTQAVTGEVEAFFVQQQGGGLKYCRCCGRTYQQGVEILQSRNPFFNKHHNNPVRGYFNNVNTGEMCPTCNLLCLLAVTHCHTPYFREPSGRFALLLPQVDDLRVLAKVFRNCRSRLLDLLAPELLSYRTNIRELRGASLYRALVAVYFNILYHYEPESEQYRYEPLLSQEEQKLVDRWVVLRYKKGQNVNFSHFHVLRVNHRLFQLVRPVVFGTGGSREGNLLTSFINRVDCDDAHLFDLLLQGLIEQDWNRVASAWFGLVKEAQSGRGRARVNGGGVVFFEQFAAYAIEEVDQVIDQQLLEDVKVIGRNIGGTFKNDIGLLTSLHNAQDPDALRRVLREVFFKLYKLMKGKPELARENEVYLPREGRVENILAAVTMDNVETIRDTMLIYACLSAMRGLMSEAKAKTEEGKQV